MHRALVVEGFFDSRLFNRFLECLWLFPLLGYWICVYEGRENKARDWAGIYFLSTRWGFTFLSFFFPWGCCLVCSNRLSRFDLWTCFFHLFFYLRFYHSGCVFLSLSLFSKIILIQHIYEHIQHTFLSIYIEIFTCLTFDFPPFFYSLPLFKCAFCVSFMNMTDMCKYGMNLRGTGVVLGWGGGGES